MGIACYGDLRARWTRDGQAFPCLQRCSAPIGAVGLSFHAGTVQIAEKAMDVRADGLRAMLASIQDTHRLTQMLRWPCLQQPNREPEIDEGLDVVPSGQLA